MFTKLLNKIVVCFVLCAFLTNVSASVDDVNRPPVHRCGHAEKMVLTKLGLREDVNDSEIIQLLDIRRKRITATLLIRYRKISSATPKLLEIFNDNKTTLFAKLSAAKALCDFGNREWVQPLKAIAIDPNGVISRTSLKIDVAGLLARAGDYSQFEVLATSINDSKDYIRFFAIQALGNFRHKTETVTDSAAELLTSAAISDPVPWLRERAIESLERIAKIKPEVNSKVISALEANIDSPDKNLRSVCRVKLTIYGRKLKTD